MIVENMLPEVRANERLGNPPKEFYTNVPESANAVIKRAVNFKESEITSFTSRLAQLIKRQREDVRGALLNSGPFKLVDTYTHLQLTKEKWCSMSSAQRSAHENKFEETWQTSADLNNKAIESEYTSRLSISAEEPNLTTVPIQQVRRVFQKVESLLSNDDTIFFCTREQWHGLYGDK